MYNEFVRSFMEVAMEKIDERRAVDRQVRARIHRLDGYERQTQVVEDLNAERRMLVSRLAQLIWLLFGSFRGSDRIESVAQVDRG